jgi:hypothetical protein
VDRSAEKRRYCRNEVEVKEVETQVEQRQWQLKGILTEFRVDEESPSVSNLRIRQHPKLEYGTNYTFDKNGSHPVIHTKRIVIYLRLQEVGGVACLLQMRRELQIEPKGSAMLEL